MTFPFHLPRSEYCTYVAAIIEYPIALARLQQLGMVCNYYNGGAFGFPKGAIVHTAGWLGEEDWTIKPHLRPILRQFPPPAIANLAKAAADVWQKEIASPAWIMPLSHWAFELDFGSRSWLPKSIEILNLGLDAKQLAHRTDASPIEFSRDERPALEHFVQTLLEKLESSDFMLAFPDRPVLCTIHHHRQLWWIASDQSLIDRINSHAA